MLHGCKHQANQAWDQICTGFSVSRVMFTHRHSSGHTPRICEATHLNQVPLELGAVGVPSVIKNCPDAASNSIRACRNEMVLVHVPQLFFPCFQHHFLTQDDGTADISAQAASFRSDCKCVACQNITCTSAGKVIWQWTMQTL
jgi:hypothetical protein